MINEGDPPRLSVVAAIIDPETSGKRALQPAARLGSRYRRASDSRAAASATPTEQELAQVLQGGQGQGGPRRQCGWRFGDGRAADTCRRSAAGR
jgi:hypothetical protein